MTVVKHLACGGLWLLASLAAAEPLIKPTAIDWLLDCPLPSADRLAADVVERTQCGSVSVPRDYAAPRQGTLRLYVTRVGARQPLSRQGVIFVHAGLPPPKNGVGTFALQLASRWSANATQAYRSLLERYDVVELSARALDQTTQVEYAARDMEYVRDQLGDAQLYYLGNADATRLGNRYAVLFPERVARMVLINADADDIGTPLVDLLRLKDPAKADAGSCVYRWVGEFLAYGKQPPSFTRCLPMSDWP